MKYALLAIFLVWAIRTEPVAAQEPVDREIIAKIRDEGTNRSRVLEFFTHFTEDIGPRLTASPAYKVAAEYAREKLTEFGLANPHIEAWDFGRGWTLEKFSLEMVEPRYMPLIGYPEGWSPSTPGELTATPLFLGDKTQEAIEKMRDQIKGAI